MHCKPDLVAREVAEEVVDRLPPFVTAKLSAIPYSFLDKQRGNSVGIIAIIAIIPIARLQNLNCFDIFKLRSAVASAALSTHCFFSSRNRDRNSIFFLARGSVGDCATAGPFRMPPRRG